MQQLYFLFGCVWGLSSQHFFIFHLVRTVAQNLSLLLKSDSLVFLHDCEPNDQLERVLQHQQFYPCNPFAIELPIVSNVTIEKLYRQDTIQFSNCEFARTIKVNAIESLQLYQLCTIQCYESAYQFKQTKHLKSLVNQKMLFYDDQPMVFITVNRNQMVKNHYFIVLFAFIHVWLHFIDQEHPSEANTALMCFHCLLTLHLYKLPEVKIQWGVNLSRFQIDSLFLIS